METRTDTVHASNRVFWKVTHYEVKYCIGSKSREIYNTFTFAEQDDNMKFDKIIEKFDGYFTPKKNLTLLRFKFFTARQQDGESFDEFLT